MTKTIQILDLENRSDCKEAVRRTNTVIKNLEMCESYTLENGYLIIKLNNIWIMYRFYYLDEDTFYFEQTVAQAPQTEVEV